MSTTVTEGRFTDLLASEWIRIRSLRSVAWAIGLSGLLVVVMNIGAALTDHVKWFDYGESVRAGFFPHWSIDAAFSQGAMMVSFLAVSAIGAVLVASEYGTGMIRTTFAAVPARRTLMAAKLLVTAALFTVWGAIVATVSFFGSQWILSWHDVGVPITHPGALRVVTASALLAPLAALVGMGLATLLRHVASSIVAAVGLLLLAPALINSRQGWLIHVDNAFPMTAWMRLSDLSTDVPPPYLGLPGAWTVNAVWTTVAVALATVAVRRDP
ncbi:ABC transporter permease [Phytomonospora endophytica]|uniref:ABC transporter permease n=1 Tax=Phytomonospora endophytica TaxID=714109 RepID=A0A841FS03_9ACTN|nr:ABC transporter permease [Phytomonospora endophytica]MBB6036087.1 hypothetical protein [Phytomonospora endophytica]GIG66990.1 ABC transporter permease [Phytomonospora endophytica]